MPELLDVADLTVSFPTADGVVRAVRGLDFRLTEGRTLGIVGESGSGKSAAMLAMLGLSGGRVTGRASFDGQDLLTMRRDQLRRLRGAEVSMIFQDPLTSLHPLYRVGWQIAETIRVHQRISRGRARRRAIELLDRVGIPQPDRQVDAYPHEFSGGMRQRAMIAMALALRPRLLIADEPTTALDVTVQAQIIELIRALQAETGMAVVLITHDLGVVAEVADEVLVMYAGKAVEHAARRQLFHGYHHPYTRGLLSSLPATHGDRDRLEPILGQPPSLIQLPPGCPFHPRCPYVFDRCPLEEPPLMTVAAGHRSACWLPGDLRGPGSDTSRVGYAGRRRYRREVLRLLVDRERREEASAR